MRKLIIFVALFMLLSVPALAASDTVDATINVSEVWHIWSYGELITFTINNGEYDNGWVKPDNDECVHFTIKSNKDYNMRVNRDTPAGWPTDWVLYVKEGGQASCGDYIVTTAGVADYWAADKPPTNGDSWYFFFIICYIEYEDDWVGSHPLTITFTLQ